MYGSYWIGVFASFVLILNMEFNILWTLHVIYSDWVDLIQTEYTERGFT